ncbi:MAG TPA: class I adenylate-forming enzyme family protein [Acidimicrobiales bacterium]|nr:class I adenylate-forming enzyme family protein [Acidimicrobiales bacterium]
MSDARTFPELLGRNAAVYGEKPAVVTWGTVITHAALDAESAALAAQLVAAGVGKGARVGLLAPNTTDWAVTAAAVMRAGAVLVPLSTLLRPPELASHLAAAGVAHLVLSPEFRGRTYLEDLDAIAPGALAAIRAGRRPPQFAFLRHVWVMGALPEASVDGDLVAALEDRVRAADDMVVLFTSGSRGAPKGTVHTHGGALRAVASGLEARCIGEHDRVYIPMPFFWTGGFSSGLLSVLVAGATLLTEEVPEPSATLALLEREGATLFRGWPDQAARLAADPRFAAADLSGLGAGSLPAVLPPERRPGPGARANLFGMTETFGPYCGARLDVDLPDGKQGSCGQPFEGVEVRVVDPGTGTPCAPGVAGEIRVRGSNVMRAICGRTRDATFDVDGFYPTGDLGALDADGFLWFHGRLDDMFKVRGATVYPSEVEGALRRLPGVRQAHVTNVPDDEGSEAVAALVIADAPLDALVAAARSHLSAFKVPTRWVVSASADVVPMTATAKVDKEALQAMLKEGERT